MSAVCICLDPMKAIRTELSLTRDEFDGYNVGVDAEVTFCLKEFRVCVVLAAIYFDTNHANSVSCLCINHIGML